MRASRRRWRAGWTALCAAIAVLALSAAPASAEKHLPKEVFGSAAQPSFVTAEEMATIPAGLAGEGDLLAIDAGAQTISRFKPNGEADPFAALGTDVIDGKGSGGGCTPPSAECDETPQNGLAFGTQLETQLAVAPASAGETAGDIYITQPSTHLIDIFAPDGRYLGPLSEAFNPSHELKPFGEACGVAVDQAGAVYVGDFEQGIHKFAPSANPPVNGDNSANFTAATTTVNHTCALAAGSKPSASGGSEGFLFAGEYNGGENGKVVKLDSSTGAIQYVVAESGKTTTLSVNEATGHLYVAVNLQGASIGEIGEYDASDSAEAFLASKIAVGGGGAPVSGNVYGLAISPTGATSGDVYVSAEASTHLGVWGPAVPEPPTIEEEAATAVGEEEATLSAKIGAEGSPTHFQLQYGTAGPCSADPCAETTLRSAGSAHVPVTLTEALPGLSEGTRYWWRVVAENGVGESKGPDVHFTTPRTHPFELPDERLWEMVSPPQKWGGEVALPGNVGGQHEFSARPLQASPDGEAITYASFTSFGEAEGAGLTSQFLSRRGAAGWETESITPTFEEGYARDPLVGFSPDLAHGAIISRDPPLAEGAQPHVWNLYRRDWPGAFATVSAGTVESANIEHYCLAFAGATPGFDRVIFAARGGRLRPPDPLPGIATADLYEWTPGGGPVLASVLPDGTPAPASETSSFGAARLPPFWNGAGACDMEKALLRHAISADGTKLFWTYGGSYGTFPNEVVNPLLARLDGSETIQLDANQGGSAFESGKGKYQDASVNGSRVFFTDGLALTPDSHATEAKPDLYLYDFEKPSGSRLSDLTAGAAGAIVQGAIGADEAGDSVYFVAKGALTEESEENANHEHAELNKLNLYAWHEGETHFVAQLAEGDEGDWSTEPQKQTARVSPDGRYLAFVSTRSLSGYDNKPGPGAASGCASACSEVFRYDRQSETLICASCNPTNQRPGGRSTVPTWAAPYQQPRYLLDDGRVYFQSQDALDRNDTDGTQDVYQLEPAGVGGCTGASKTFSASAEGCVDLISSGKSDRDSYLLDASADGRDVFISTRQVLVPELDKDTASDVYDTRVGGSPPPPPPVVCEAECHEGSTAAGPALAAGTASAQFPGNPPAVRGCARGKVKRKGRCVKRKAQRHHRRAHDKRRKSR